MLTRKKIITGLVLILGIVILANLVADRFFVRLDFTQGHQFTLSKATKNILNSLDGTVTVRAYFSENLPPNISAVRREFKDMLVEYNNASGGKVVYEFINPNKDMATERKAQQEGISPIMINVRERDQMKQQRAYMGAVLQYQGKTERIPFIKPGAAMEYELSSMIKKLSLKKKIKVALLQGNGEPALSELPQLNEQLNILYNVSPYHFNDTAEIPQTYKTLVIIAPKDTIKPAYIKQINDFVAGGGRVLIALDRVVGNFKNATGSAQSTGLNDWLKGIGINVQGEFIVDAHCGNVMIRQQQGMLIMNTPVKFPYLPIIQNFADNPITKGLQAVMMPFVSPIKFSPKNKSVNMVALATTSKKTGLQKPPVYFNAEQKWNASDFTKSSLPVAVAANGKLVGNTDSKLVVFGNGDFAVNGSGQRKQKLQQDNVNLMANAIDWLSDDTGLISLRTKNITSRPLNANIGEGTKTFVKYLNFLLPILLILGYGLFRYERRKRLRNKWMNEDYVQ